MTVKVRSVEVADPVVGSSGAPNGVPDPEPAAADGSAGGVTSPTSGHVQSLRRLRRQALHERTGGRDVVDQGRRLAGEGNQLLQPVLDRSGSHLGAEAVRRGARPRRIGVPPVYERRAQGARYGRLSARRQRWQDRISEVELDRVEGLGREYRTLPFVADAHLGGGEESG